METLQNNNNAEPQNTGNSSDWEIQMTELINKNNFGYYRNRSEIHYGPPPDWNKDIPNHSMEVFIGALPRDVNIYELILLIEEELGNNCIYELSVMLDILQNLSSKTLRNRGFAFVTFINKDLAVKCRVTLDNKEIRPGKRIRINQSTPNLHLFVANVPCNKGREEILRDIRDYTEGLKDVIIFAAKTGSGEMDTKRHRGFIFLEYETHSAAANARKKLAKPGFRLWNRELKVDWAAKKQEPSQEVMAKVKSIYVRNLTAECTDQNLKDHFSKYGEIESVKKVRDFAFIHFKDRSSAIEALESSNKTILPDSISNGTIDIELVKPNIHSQFRSLTGFPFPNLMGTPFLPYPPPYGLPFPPPPGHLIPPHLMYGSTSQAYYPFNKNKPWSFMNGTVKHGGGMGNFHSYPRHNRSQPSNMGNGGTTANNRQHIPLSDHSSVTNNSTNVGNNGTNKWSGNVYDQSHYDQCNSGTANHHRHNSSTNTTSSPVGASGDTPTNNSLSSTGQRTNSVNSGPNSNLFDYTKRIKSLKQAGCNNPQALFYWGLSHHNDFLYRDSPFLGWG